MREAAGPEPAAPRRPGPVRAPGAAEGVGGVAAGWDRCQMSLTDAPPAAAGSCGALPGWPWSAGGAAGGSSTLSGSAAPGDP